MTDTEILIAVGGLAVLAIGAIAFALFSDGKPNRAEQFKRGAAAPAKAARGQGGFKALFNNEPQTAVDRLRELAEEQKRIERANLRLRITQAGLTSSPAQFLLGFYLVGAAIGAGAFMATGQALAGAAAAVAVGFMGPKIILKRRINARVRKFSEHFPIALDVIVRGVRSGLPVSESLKIVANEVPDPVGSEIERLIVGASLGQSMEDGLRQMAMRVPSQDVNFFRTVLSIQQKTGGNLAETLENLSNVLRERKKMKLKIRALSSEARMSAIIVGSLPFIVAGLVYLLRPDYITIMFVDSRGQYLLLGGMVWMSFGILMMRKMVRFKV